MSVWRTSSIRWRPTAGDTAPFPPAWRFLSARVTCPPSPRIPTGEATSTTRGLDRFGASPAGSSGAVDVHPDGPLRVPGGSRGGKLSQRCHPPVAEASIACLPPLFLSRLPRANPARRQHSPSLLLPPEGSMPVLQ